MTNKMKHKSILFVCTGNAFRSQIAEGFARKLFPKGWEIYSAGTMAAGLSKTAAEAMREIGIDISGQYSKTLHEVPCDKVDYVVTLCDHARAGCPVFPKIKLQEHWPIADPLSATGVEPIEAVRKTRDEIGQRMKDLVKRIA